MLHCITLQGNTGIHTVLLLSTVIMHLWLKALKAAVQMIQAFTSLSAEYFQYHSQPVHEIYYFHSPVQKRDIGADDYRVKTGNHEDRKSITESHDEKDTSEQQEVFTWWRRSRRKHHQLHKDGQE